MKICAAQIKPIKGDIENNISNHRKLIDHAVSEKATIIIFPELSLTGYEPGLAKELATDQDDSRFDVFQQISDTKHITIGAGMPLKNSSGITISMIIFEPGKPRRIYSKQHLHADERPYFVGGNHQVFLERDKNKTALSICYELSAPEHSENAYKNGAKIYISSVAKSVSGTEKALESLSGIAKKYSMTVLMSNCIGHCDNFNCGGKSSAWNDKGELTGQLDVTNEGILIIDTDTKELIEKTI
jgi:predicted amidohydrolase